MVPGTVSFTVLNLSVYLCTTNNCSYVKEFSAGLQYCHKIFINIEHNHCIGKWTTMWISSTGSLNPEFFAICGENENLLDLLPRRLNIISAFEAQVWSCENMLTSLQMNINSNPVLLMTGVLFPAHTIDSHSTEACVLPQAAAEELLLQ